MGSVLDHFIGKACAIFTLLIIGIFFWKHTYREVWLGAQKIVKWINEPSQEAMAKSLKAHDKSLIYKVWKGEKPLAFIFWLVFIVPNFFLNAILNADKHQEIPFIVICFIVIYFIFSSMATWNTARKSTSKFNVAAKGFVVFAWVVNSFFVLVVFFAVLSAAF